MPAPVNQVDSIIAMAPAYEFSYTCDTNRYTKAIALCKTADLATDLVSVRNEIAAAAVVFAFDTRFLPLRTKTAVTCAATYTVIYCY